MNQAEAVEDEVTLKEDASGPFILKRKFELALINNLKSAILVRSLQYLEMKQNIYESGKILEDFQINRLVINNAQICEQYQTLNSLFHTQKILRSFMNEYKKENREENLQKISLGSEEIGDNGSYFDSHVVNRKNVGDE